MSVLPGSQGLGTDEDSLIRIICSRTNQGAAGDQQSLQGSGSPRSMVHPLHLVSGTTILAPWSGVQDRIPGFHV